ncbi:hypothetical protein CEXT_253661 [Caerostris extrusa]|uniref:Uncharacterized protein n=1 Tax=Caerostris extrusa TaxID=172846 RepID=A0AAV4Q2N8_CAEEX|nr:hypothetical protein CEXT_253661 [Caerostris extrusa]
MAQPHWWEIITDSKAWRCEIRQAQRFKFKTSSGCLIHHAVTDPQSSCRYPPDSLRCRSVLYIKVSSLIFIITCNSRLLTGSCDEDLCFPTVSIRWQSGIHDLLFNIFGEIITKKLSLIQSVSSLPWLSSFEILCALVSVGKGCLRLSSKFFHFITRKIKPFFQNRMIIGS